MDREKLEELVAKFPNADTDKIARVRRLNEGYESSVTKAFVREFLEEQKKVVNYGPQATAMMIAVYNSSPGQATIDALAEGLGKTVLSVTAKLSREGVDLRALRSAEEQASLAQTEETIRNRRQGITNTTVYGVINPALKCPHCDERGKVRTRIGTSTTVTKLNWVILGRNKTTTNVTKFHCDNCGIDWEVPR